ncbi:MAG: hypothetical protein MHMPM18_000212 [Marteilia pararefringens]
MTKFGTISIFFILFTNFLQFFVSAEIDADMIPLDDCSAIRLQFKDTSEEINCFSLKIEVEGDVIIENSYDNLKLDGFQLNMNNPIFNHAYLVTISDCDNSIIFNKGIANVCISDSYPIDDILSVEKILNSKIIGLSVGIALLCLLFIALIGCWCKSRISKNAKSKKDDLVYISDNGSSYQSKLSDIKYDSKQKSSLNIDGCEFYYIDHEFKILNEAKNLHKISKISLKNSNQDYHKFHAVLPYEHSQVFLKNSRDIFLNSTYIPDYPVMLSETPFSSQTFARFIVMIIENKISSIVDLCDDSSVNFWENFKQRHTYIFTISNYDYSFEIRLKSREHFEYFVKYNYFLTFNNKDYEFERYHFKLSFDELSDLRILVFISFVLHIVSHIGHNDLFDVQCCDGAGRSGVFLVMFKIISQSNIIQNDRLSYKSITFNQAQINLPSIISQMRQSKSEIVRTQYQYRFLSLASQEFLCHKLHYYNDIDSLNQCREFLINNQLSDLRKYGLKLISDDKLPSSCFTALITYMMPSFSNTVKFLYSNIPCSTELNDKLFQFYQRNNVKYIISFIHPDNDDSFGKLTEILDHKIENSSNFDMTIRNLSIIGGKMMSRKILISSRRIADFKFIQYIVKDFSNQTFMELKSLVDNLILNLEYLMILHFCTTISLQMQLTYYFPH